MVSDDIKIKPLQRQKVCVIGAGMAGLASARELRREGHDVTVLEQSGDVGGQWLYDPRVDGDDLLGAVEPPVKVHGSMYASLRLISARENMGFTDFQFAPQDGRDGRRFPGHREVYLYLKDFCGAFGLMESVRLNTSVVRVAPAPGPTLRWTVRSVHLGKCDGEGAGEVVEEEVFDAVVVANGHYSQPRLPSIEGMEAWRGRQMHSHSYRVPEPFRGEVVVVVGCGESGKDIAMEVRRVAKEVHLVAKSMEEVTQGLAKVLAKHSASLHLQLHVFAPWFFEAQAKWVAQVLSGKRTLPSEEEMMRSVEEYYRARETVGAPRKYTHDVGLFDTTYIDEFGSKYCDFPGVDKWRYELLLSSFVNMLDNLETFRDEYKDSDSIRKGVEEWHLSAQQAQVAATKKQSFGLLEQAE
ncbi:hypothetical protein ACQJBY_038024 [Aegilops geniculata]